ncbi:MAG TPA: polymer-forming cytoskeletal protein [Chitinophagaceae bacterium]|nr:polymer-forming cytoskeletal protein [Chitinophagaceae bacterium]
MKFENILQAAVGKDFFFIPKGMVIEGTVGSLVSGQVAGTINGNVTVKNKLTLLKDAVVNGNITAGELHVYGRLNGDVLNCEKMVVYSGAAINGHVTAFEIHTEKNATIEGEIIKSRIPVSTLTLNNVIKKEEDTREKYQVNMNQNNSENTERQAWF